MEKPSLSEVKEYFKNAETAEDWSGTINKVTLEKLEITEHGDVIQDTFGANWLVLFYAKKGYAKILTYKNTEPKFEITKEQILTIHEKTSVINQEELQEWFPEAFKTEPKHGEYWFHSTGKLVFIEETTALKTVKCRHIDNNKNLAFHGVDCMDRKATTEEVTEALKNEAFKRYKKGDYLICLHHGTYLKIDLEYKTALNEKGFWHGGKCVMKDGKWASVIPTKTIQEAEELLKELGHNFKIV